MKIVISESQTFREVVDPIVNLVQEGVFNLEETGVSLKAMDPSMISMISFFLPKDFFEEYLPEDTGTLGVDFSQLGKILSRGKRSEKLVMEADGNMLMLSFQKEKSKRSFKMRLLDLSQGSQKEPRVEYKSNIEMSSEAFKEAIKDAKLVSTYARLSLNKEKFSVSVSGDGGEVEEEFENGGEEVLSIESEGPESAAFPLDYLEDIMKACPPSSPVKIYLSTDKPLKLEYAVNSAQVRYYLAPRIES